MGQQTVTINGTVYDAHTGMPLEKLESPGQVTPDPLHAHHQARPSDSVHQTTQKSQTLNRLTVDKDEANPHATPRPSVQKSPAITKFAPHQAAPKSKAQVISDIGPLGHPMVTKAQKQMQTAAREVALAPKPADVIKQEAIDEALKKAPSHMVGARQVKPAAKRSRFFTIAASSFALLLLGGYFTYLNMPSLSVRVAAAQAGVNATYPEYRPDGYSLHGPVAYNQGEVNLKFAANAGPHNFSITQTKSNWDSSALEENYVVKASNGGYVPYIEHGLKIYVFDNNAAWVNGGVLYKITGDAPLSNDQIRHIATSM